MHDVGFSKLIASLKFIPKRFAVVSVNCNVQRKCAGSVHVEAGEGAGCRAEGVEKWRRYKLPEEQPDGVNKGPEIVVTINFGAGVEANISEYLSEILANRRHIIKHDTDVVTNRKEHIDDQHSNTGDSL